MKPLQRIRSLFGKKTVEKYPYTDPLQPDFDIQAWLSMRQEIEEKYPDAIDGFFPTGPAALLGFSDHVTPEEDAEQERRLAEWERQQEEAKHPPGTLQRKVS